MQSSILILESYNLIDDVIGVFEVHAMHSDTFMFCPGSHSS